MLIINRTEKEYKFPEKVYLGKNVVRGEYAEYIEDKEDINIEFEGNSITLLIDGTKFTEYQSPVIKSFADYGKDKNSEFSFVSKNVTRVHKLNINMKYAHSLFNGQTKLTDISGLADWDVSKATSLSHIFYECRSLTDLSPLASWNVENVEYMDGCFAYCDKLSNINPLRNWRPKKAITFQNLFAYCGKISDISPLANWETRNVTEMTSAFDYCSSLRDISPLANWQTQNVKTFENMFNGCSKLYRIDCPNWNFASCTNLNMFGANYEAPVRYLNLKGIGDNYDFMSFLLPFDAGKDGDGETNCKQALIDTLITNSTDRAANGYPMCSVYYIDVYFTDDEIQQARAKGYDLIRR